MLKIKDNVDLKELKNFGFIEYQSCDDGETYYCKSYLYIGKDKIINQDDNINCCKPKDYELTETDVNILYDLIKADLVEKI